ncbi:MAG: aspartyl protease family protein [Crenarchaeota archaeon]|nr:aspartyl protease family protein [Thermoproteota archaeon]
METPFLETVVGVFKVKARVWNVFVSAKETDVELTVDSGFTYTVLPGSLLEKLDVKPIRRVRLRLADNRVVERELGEVGIEIEGYRLSSTPVIFGDEDAYLLGSVAMEGLSLAPDVVKKKLVPVEALLM